MPGTKLAPREVHAALNCVNWDFPGATTLESTVHSLHRFPGNFIPQIPSYLIQLLSEQGDLVFDPFCGSGTTGVEAAILGRRVWQTDANRVSILVTEGKIATLIDPIVRDDLTRLVQEFFWILPTYRTQGTGKSRDGINPELTKWFHPDTLAQLQTIWRLISSSTNAATNALLAMLFSDTLFACASTGQALTSGGKPRRHHWGWIADNVRPNRLNWHNAERLFHERLIRAFKIALTQPNVSKIEAKIERQDIRSLAAPASTVDLVVTSPPYLGMIDYALANRLTYLWFNWPMDEDREVEIGARYRRNRASADITYLESIDIAAQKISELLKEKRYCAVVIGASRKFPGMAEKVLNLFGQYMTPINEPLKRSSSRRRVSDRKGSQFQELVSIFRK